jgi:spore photoproduct lyase
MGREKLYTEFLEELLGRVPLQRLTLGGICIYAQARSLMEMKIGHDNVISRHLERSGRALRDGRERYTPDLRARMYAHLDCVARRIRPDLEPALCLEEEGVWHSAGLSSALGRCNCVL